MLACVYSNKTKNSVASNSDITFRGIAASAGEWWAYGSGILIRSVDGKRWKDTAGYYNFPGSFTVCEIVEGVNGTFVFSRSEHGLLCHEILRGSEICKVVSVVPSASASVSGVFIRQGIMMCVKESGSARFLQYDPAANRWIRLPSKIKGVPVYFQIDENGYGVCALWGTDRPQRINEATTSAIYCTFDYCRSWEKVQDMDTMLLVGSATPDQKVLVGGTESFVAEGDCSGFASCFDSSPGSIIAISSGCSQLAVIHDSD